MSLLDTLKHAIVEEDSPPATATEAHMSTPVEIGAAYAPQAPIATPGADGLQVA